jgi:hypothetical protein
MISAGTRSHDRHAAPVGRADPACRDSRYGATCRAPDRLPRADRLLARGIAVIGRPTGKSAHPASPKNTCAHRRVGLSGAPAGPDASDGVAAEWSGKPRWSPSTSRRQQVARLAATIRKMRTGRVLRKSPRDHDPARQQARSVHQHAQASRSDRCPCSTDTRADPPHRGRRGRCQQRTLPRRPGWRAGAGSSPCVGSPIGGGATCSLTARGTR